MIVKFLEMSIEISVQLTKPLQPEITFAQQNMHVLSSFFFEFSSPGKKLRGEISQMLMSLNHTFLYVYG